MLTLPPMPEWQTIHPLLVHFPIALLLVSPLFIVIGILRKPAAVSTFMVTALILMGLGTAGTFAAAASGDAAGEFVEKIPGVTAVLEQHEALAESTEIVFTALTVIFAAIVFVPRLMKSQPTSITSVFLPRHSFCYMPAAPSLWSTPPIREGVWYTNSE